jgi:ABC-type multidrug transport system fused ATPase/permease subunit
LAANAAAFVTLIHDAVSGTVNAGLLVTLAQAILAMAAFGPQNDPQQGLARTTSAIAELVRMRTEQALPALTTIATATAPTQSKTGSAEIRLEDVTFTYPSQDRPTLNGLSLHIPAGQALALVGLNGAGKSTLIKLLCGLEQPDRGTVRMDGADPGRDDAARRRVGVIFQDYVRYHLSLRENVGVGALGHQHEILERALTDARGGTLLRRLEHGWDTVLSSEYDNGTDLSGGQWQRVALARALAALGRGAGILVLDEPTAALDIRAEAALFERFLTVARGATTILVSHRLSSVRRADRIVVLADTGDGARIVEDGSHEELMERGRRYAELFTLQASRFEGENQR